MNTGFKFVLWATFFIPPLVIAGMIWFGSFLLGELHKEPEVRVVVPERIVVIESSGELSIPVVCHFPERKVPFLPARFSSVRAKFSVVPSSAVHGRDFVAPKSFDLSFEDASSSKITVKLVDSLQVEGSRLLSVNLEELSGAKFEGPKRIEVEIKDDETPSLWIKIPSVIEVENVQQVLATVEIKPPFAYETRLVCRTRDGDAVAGRDYDRVDSEVLIPPGQPNYPVELTVRRGSGLRTERQFFLSATLFAGTEEVVSAESAIRLRLLSPPVVSVVLSDMEWRVTQDSQTIMTPVRLSGPTDVELPLRVVTEDGTARAGVHYQAKNERLIFRPGEVRREVAISLLPREPDGSTVSFRVKVTSEKDATVLGVATITLRYPAPQPLLEIPDKLTVSPHPWEKTTLRVNLRLSRPAEEPCSVYFETVPGEAKPPQYVSARGHLVFDRGEQVKQIQLELVGLPVGSRDQSFRISFSNPQMLRLSRKETVITIQALQGLTGSALVIVPLTESLHEYWNQLHSQLQTVAEAPDLVGQALWIVDGENRLSSWREGSLPDGLKIEDRDFTRAFECSFVSVDSLQRIASTDISAVTIVWISELNPDYGDLSQRITVPSDRKYQVIWVREGSGGRPRVSKRLSFWFGEDKSFCAGYGEVSDVFFKNAR